jgi:signal recognition particle subunit SRP68
MDITRSIVSERDRGLLNGDYDAYHAQAGRRIHTLRKRLGIATPRNRKYTPKATVTGEQLAQNVEWARLLLASSERAWASAMAMKSAQSQENTQKPMAGSTKRQIVSRLRRAISYAENLVASLSDVNTKTSKADVLEAKAYLFMLQGSLDFEKSRWQSCLSNYAVPRVTYASLGKAAKTDVYKDLLSTVVDPSLRYSAHHLKLPRTKPVDEIAVENFPSDESAAKRSLTEIDPDAFKTTKEMVASDSGSGDVLTHITWRKRKVKLEDAAISQALSRAQQGETRLETKLSAYKEGSISANDFAAAYDEIIEARQDAADATKSAIDDLTAEGVDTGDSRIQSLQITRTAVNYAVIEYRVGRNRVLCGADDGLNLETEQRKHATASNSDSRPGKPESTGRQLARLREHTALYDLILRSLESVKELPGVIADEAFVSELDAKHAYFRSLKCATVGRSHVLNGHTANALALFDRASELAQTASEALTTSSAQSTSEHIPRLDVTAGQLKSSTTHLSALVTRYRGLTELENLSFKPTSKGTGKAAVQRPLAEALHLNIYHDSIDPTNIVNYPAKLQPIPVKPLFFDLAWNYIDYPSHELKSRTTEQPAHKSTQPAAAEPSSDEKPTETKKKGWFGFGRG